MALSVTDEQPWRLIRLSRGQPVTISVEVAVLSELDEHTVGIWLHHSGGPNKEDELPEVEGSNENVEEEVLFCLKKSVEKIPQRMDYYRNEI